MNFNKNALSTAFRSLACSMACLSSLASAVTAEQKLQYDTKNAVEISKQVFGRIAAAVPTVANSSGETPIGDLIADAQLMATQPANLGRAEFALVDGAGSGSDGLIGKYYPRDVIYDDLLSLQQTAGMALITISLTAQQIKYVLEQQFAGCGAQVQQRILQVSNGFSFSWKTNGEACAKIWEVKLTHIDMSQSPPSLSGMTDVMVSAGVVLNPSKTYRITVNAFLAKGRGNFTLLKDGLNPIEGVSEMDALAAYLENFKFPKPAYDPNDVSLNKPRIIQIPVH